MNWILWNFRGDRFADRIDRQRLGETGYALEQDVPTGEQSDEDALDHHVLADHDLVHFVKNRIDEGALALDHFVDGSDVVRH